jgi:hypothetical protein
MWTASRDGGGGRSSSQLWVSTLDLDRLDKDLGEINR